MGFLASGLACKKRQLPDRRYAISPTPKFVAEIDDATLQRAYFRTPRSAYRKIDVLKSHPKKRAFTNSLIQTVKLIGHHCTRTAGSVKGAKPGTLLWAEFSSVLRAEGYAPGTVKYHREVLVDLGVLEDLGDGCEFVDWHTCNSPDPAYWERVAVLKQRRVVAQRTRDRDKKRRRRAAATTARLALKPCPTVDASFSSNHAEIRLFSDASPPQRIEGPEPVAAGATPWPPDLSLETNHAEPASTQPSANLGAVVTLAALSPAAVGVRGEKAAGQVSGSAGDGAAGAPEAVPAASGSPVPASSGSTDPANAPRAKTAQNSPDEKCAEPVDDIPGPKFDVRAMFAAMARGDTTALQALGEDADSRPDQSASPWGREVRPEAAYRVAPSVPTRSGAASTPSRGQPTAANGDALPPHAPATVEQVRRALEPLRRMGIFVQVPSIARHQPSWQEMTESVEVVIKALEKSKRLRRRSNSWERYFYGVVARKARHRISQSQNGSRGLAARPTAGFSDV